MADRRLAYLHILALVQEAEAGWSFALAVPPDGEILTGRLSPARLGSSFPSATDPIAALLDATQGQVDVVLVLDAGDPDPEITAFAIAPQMIGARVRVVGAVVVSRTEVLKVIGMAETDGCRPVADPVVIERVNTLCEGDLRPDQFDEAWAIGMVVAGMGKPVRSKLLLRLLHTPVTPSSQVNIREPRTRRRHSPGMTVAFRSEDEVVPGVTREELIRKAGF